MQDRIKHVDQLFVGEDKRIVLDGCMITHTGQVFDLMNPDPEQINLEDIAYGLGFTCRWNGGLKTYFSVAEHCCRMYDSLPEPYKATALFHDAEEAYWGDIISPVKRLMSHEMRKKMADLRELVFAKYNINPIDEVVEKEDARMLEWELENVVKRATITGASCYDAAKQWLWRAELVVRINRRKSGKIEFLDESEPLWRALIRPFLTQQHKTL
jgi:hypothetical protein